MTAVLQSGQNFAVSVARNVRPGEVFPPSKAST